MNISVTFLKDKKLCLSPHEEGDEEEWEVHSFPTTIITIDGVEHVVEFPEVFISDLASTPGLFWFVLPPHGKYTKAVILHDLLYRTNFSWCDRKIADLIFKKVCEVSRVPYWKKMIMFDFLKALGWTAWKKKK